MADIYPFCGVRFNPSALDGDVAAVVSPPYDVISPDEQNDLYDQNAHNVVRLILGREPDRYAEAKRVYQEWRDAGVLLPDDSPSVYVYRQSFHDPETNLPLPERVGLTCLLKLEEYSTGIVLRHENTLSAAKVDRLHLFQATNCQFESIYLLYSDPDGSVRSFLKEYDDQLPSIQHVESAIGSSHSMEQLTDPDAIEILQELMRDKQLFIADGHHRYETSLNYRREIRDTLGNPDTAIPADYILVTLTAFEDEGLLVLPTHRMVANVDATVVEALPDTLAKRFTVTPMAADGLAEAIAGKARAGRKAFGVVLPRGRSVLATLELPISHIPSIIPAYESDAWKQLDVTILHKLILEDQLGIDPPMLAAGGKVSYTRHADEAIRRVESGEYQAAFILGRPSVTDIRDVSLDGDLMPQKSTFFYPKLLTGLVMRDLTIG